MKDIDGLCVNPKESVGDRVLLECTDGCSARIACTGTASRVRVLGTSNATQPEPDLLCPILRRKTTLAFGSKAAPDLCLNILLIRQYKWVPGKGQCSFRRHTMLRLAIVASLIGKTFENKKVSVSATATSGATSSSSCADTITDCSSYTSLCTNSAYHAVMYKVG